MIHSISVIESSRWDRWIGRKISEKIWSTYCRCGQSFVRGWIK